MIKDSKKAKLLAKEIKRLANTQIHCFAGYVKPPAVSVRQNEFKPATPGQVLAELNAKRGGNRGINVWTMTIMDDRPTVLFFRPFPRSKKTITHAELTCPAIYVTASMLHRLYMSP